MGGLGARVGGGTALMRGHGCTVAGNHSRRLFYTAVYLEVNLNWQWKASRLEGPSSLPPEKSRKSASLNRGKPEGV